jgi:hypothetical protein
MWLFELGLSHSSSIHFPANDITPFFMAENIPSHGGADFAYPFNSCWAP